MPLPNRNSQPPSHLLQPSGSLPKPVGNSAKLPGNSNTPFPIKESFLSANRYKVNIPIAKASTPAAKEVVIPKDTSKESPKSIFQKTDIGLPRRDLRDVLRKMSYSSADKMTKARRVGEEKLFDAQKYGSYGISQRDIDLRVRRLKTEQAQVARKDPNKFIEYQHEINLLNRLKNTKTK